MDTSSTDEVGENLSDIDVADIFAQTDDREGDTTVTELVEEVQASLNADESFEFDEGKVKASLDELLISLVALRSHDRNGNQLLEDLRTEFDTSASPGTVYPRLHELTDEAILEQRELIQTKEYAIDDSDAAREQVADIAKQHLMLGLLYQAALESDEVQNPQ